MRAHGCFHVARSVSGAYDHAVNARLDVCHEAIDDADPAHWHEAFRRGPRRDARSLATGEDDGGGDHLRTVVVDVVVVTTVPSAWRSRVVRVFVSTTWAPGWERIAPSRSASIARIASSKLASTGRGP